VVATHVAEMPPAFTPDPEPTIALANQVLVAVDRLAQVRNLLLLRFLLFGGHLFFLSFLFVLSHQPSIIALEAIIVPPMPAAHTPVQELLVVPVTPATMEPDMRVHVSILGGGIY